MELSVDLKTLFEAYGQAVRVRKINFTPQNAEELSMIASSLDINHWRDPNLAQQFHVHIRERVKNANGGLAQLIDDATSAYKQNGVVVFSMGEGLSRENLHDVKKQLLTLLISLGMPFGAFHQKGFWQTLGVNPNASQLRAESTGYIPLHIDFDQASSPPDGVALFCLRPDPMGGGESIVFDYQRFLDLLPKEDTQLLSRIEYSYSTLFEQNGIGDVFNPHPLLQTKQDGGRFLRYNGKLLPELLGHMSKLFTDLEMHFKSASTILPLEAGDMIVVDQNKVLHGRDALATRPQGQVVKPENDRFLLQTYLRHGL